MTWNHLKLLRGSRPGALIATACAIAMGLPVPGVLGDVGLEWREEAAFTLLGDQSRVGLYAVSDTGADVPVSAIEAIFTWDPAFIQLSGIDGTGGTSLLFSGFSIIGSSGLNELDPPQDGDGMYTALGQLGTPILATPSGTLLTTFVFDTLTAAITTPVDLLLTGGTPPRNTLVFDGIVPNTIITGSLTGTTVEVRDCGPADLNWDGVIDSGDLSLFVNLFIAGDLAADLTGDGVVDSGDLSFFIHLFLLGCQSNPNA